MAIIRQNVNSTSIVDGSITSADIADNSITTAKIADANITSDKVATDAITAAKIADSAVTTAHMHSSVPLGTRNLIINGAMQVWQRGTSFNVTSTQYTVDRWQTQGQIWTGVRSTDVPDDFQYSLDITSNSSGYGSFGQRIEAVNCKHLVGKTVTLSFYAKAVSGETNCYVLLKVPSAEDNWASSSNVSQQVISDIGSTWTKHSFTFTNLPSSVANGLLVMLFHGIGQTTQRRFTGFQLEVGDTATSFEHRPYDIELQRCRRYYEIINKRAYGFWTSAVELRVYPVFNVRKRSNYGVRLLTTTPYAEYPNVAGVTGSGSTVVSAVTNALDGTDVRINGFSGRALGQPAFIQYDTLEIDAEL